MAISFQVKSDQVFFMGFVLFGVAESYLQVRKWAVCFFYKVFGECF